ncbi:MAG: hypothetical protein HC889_20205 [Synechococcaceae cyanobacterium SM1_2_3]|nr:hypothetical protein [Synechococcaceae cyanobacterium SM1_2_3]
MSKSLTASVTPLRSAAPVPEKPRRAKCDRDVKLHISEALYDDLARVARADQRPVSEYIRVLLERHLYGRIGAGN